MYRFISQSALFLVSFTFLREPFWAGITSVKGYIGEVEFGDNTPTTKDEVGIWMGEVTHGKGQWQVALRLSGWDPDDDDGLAAANATIPNPGLNAPWTVVGGTGAASARVDQSVRRLQLGASWALSEDLVVKLEYVDDDYDKTAIGELGDVDGVIFFVNGRF